MANDSHPKAQVLRYIASTILVILLLSGHPGFAQTSLNVMTFNVRYDEALYNEGKSKKTDWAYRKELQVELIEAHHPDVVGMQEPHLHQIQYFDKQLPSYSWVGYLKFRFSSESLGISMGTIGFVCMGRVSPLSS